MRVGSGSLQFELVDDWEQLPKGWSHPDVAAVCTDASGRVFMYCRGDHPVIIYERDGTFVDSWGEGKFSYRTHGMFMTPGEQLFLVDDGGNSVGRYALDGTLLQQIGPAGVRSDTGFTDENPTVTHGGPPFNRPTNIAVARSGEIYVSDGYGNSRMHRFGEDGELISSWGEPGGEPGRFRIPHSTWVLDDGRVMVADRENERIQFFDAGGTYLTEWTDVQRPQDIFVDPAGLIYIAELGWAAGETSHRQGRITEYQPPRLSIYDPEGALLLRWCDPDLTKAGYFIAPHGIWVDDEGSIYLAEVTHTIAGSRGLVGPDAHTIQKFARL